MKGTVIYENKGNKATPEWVKESLEPHSVFISGDDQKNYFSSYADLEHNEKRILGEHSENMIHLKKGDRVEFEPAPEGNKAIHVRKIN